MAKLTFDSSTFSMHEHESVLDCLLRNHQVIPYACKAGTCQACLIKSVDCKPSGESSKWIKKTLQAQGYTLACKWIPDYDDTIAARLPNIEEFSIKVRIEGMDNLNSRTRRIILNIVEAGSMFHYQPGQYLTLINPNGIARSYSIANHYEDDQFIELHISQTSHGIFTHWLFTKAQIGDVIHLRGPAGDCFYTTEEDGNNFPVILAGLGTGLAPLYGILNDALNQQHQGPISLFHGGRTPDHLYYQEQLRQLEELHPNFKYYPCITEEQALQKDASQYFQGTIQEVFEKNVQLDSITQSRAFLCGNPDFVHSLRKNIFLKGAKSSNIYCDPFLERVVNPD